MKERKILLETAMLAQEIGFNIDCDDKFYETVEHTLDLGRGGEFTFSYHAPRVLSRGSGSEHTTKIAEAPTQTIFQKWLRETHIIDVQAYASASGYAFIIEKAYSIDSTSGGTLIKDSDYSGPNDGGRWGVFEDALEVGLQQAALYLSLILKK